MDVFIDAKVVRLQGHFGKYLVANGDETSVSQSHDGVSERSRWVVEAVEGKTDVMRLRSCHGNKYLTASDEAHKLRLAGKKVLLLTLAQVEKDLGCVEWEPIRHGNKVKLRTKGKKFLRANEGNSVSHDVPFRRSTQDTILWDVDVIEKSVLEPVLDGENKPKTPFASFTSFVKDDDVGGSKKRNRSPMSFYPKSQKSSVRSPSTGSIKPGFVNGRQDGMELFMKAKLVRLQSHLGKYLFADDDKVTVRQSPKGALQNARWTIELVDGKNNVIRLKSCHGLYLTAVDDNYLLGMTGKKVLQTLPANMTSASIEWFPVMDGGRNQVKLVTSERKYLRANGGTKPWRNTVTHDVPYANATQDWVLWGVEVVNDNDDDNNVLSVSDCESDTSCLSPVSSLNSSPGDINMFSPREESPNTQSALFEEASEKQEALIRDNNGRRRVAQFLFYFIISGLVGLIFMYFMRKTLPFIWSFTFVIMMLVMKMIKQLVSDSVEDWIVKFLLYICTYLVFGRNRNAN